MHSSMSRFLAAMGAATMLAAPADAAIKGVVITTEGRAVGEARIMAYAPERGEKRIQRILSENPARTALTMTVSDAKGAFSLDTKNEALVEVVVEAAGFEPVLHRLAGQDEAILALRPAVSKNGIIRGDGKPLANATVILSGRGGAELQTRTDAEGRYAIPNPDTWLQRVTVIHPEFALDRERGAAEGPFGPRTRIDRTLDRGVTLVGKVLSEDGKTGLAGANLLVDGWPMGKSREDGSFELVRVPSRWREIEASTGALTGARTSGQGELRIRVIKASTLTGTLRDGKNQQPLAGALISIGGQDRTTLTDAKGNFSFNGIPGGKYAINGILPGYSIATQETDVRPRESANRVLNASRTATVIGYVVDDSKKPIPGTIVTSLFTGEDGLRMMRMMMSRGQFGQPASYSAPDGRFIVRQLESDRELELVATKKGTTNGRNGPLKLAGGERKSGVVITVPRGFEITGTVTDSEGQALEGVSIVTNESASNQGQMMMRMMMGGEDDSARPSTAADGTFKLQLKEGKYDLTFQKSGFASRMVRAFSARADAMPLEVKMETGAEIHGRVIRTDGSGISDVSIAAMGESRSDPITTGADGSFVVTGLSPGMTMLMARKPDDFIQEMKSVTAPATDVVFEVETRGRISGKVVDKTTKQPINDFQAGLSGARGNAMMRVVTQPMLKTFRTDDGSFVLTNLRLGQVDLIVQAPGYIVNRATSLNLTADKAVDDLVVELETGVKLSGKVTGPDGAPLAGVMVGVESEEGREQMSMGGDRPSMTDGSGEYVIDALEPGERSVNFLKRGYITERKAIKLAGKEARLDARLSQGMDVSGVVITDQGMPVADAEVFASSSVQNSSSGSTRTDTNGAFKITGLAPGRYSFRARKSGYTSSLTKDVDIQTVGTVRITLQSGGVISGRVLGISETDYSKVQVNARGSGNAGASAQLDPTGSFRIENAPTGTVRVEAMIGGFGGMRNTPPKTVEVTSGSEVSVDLEFKSDTVIRGIVTRGGKPSASVSVMFQPRQATVRTYASVQTDSSGGYEASGLEPGEYDVMVMDMQTFGAYQTTYTVRASDTFDIEIKSSTIEGTVTDAETGEPIQDAIVHLEQATSGGSMFQPQVTTNSAGRFIMESVSEGNYRLRAQKKDYGQQTLELPVGSEARGDIELKLTRNDGVSFRVVDARDGKALNAHITVRDLQGQSAYEGYPRPGSDGSLRTPVAPGSYRATVTASGYAPRIVGVTSPSANNAVAMTPGGTILVRSKESRVRRGKLLVPSGEEYPRGPRRRGEMAIEPGQTPIENVAPGSYVIQILNDDGTVEKTVQVTVAEGAVATVDV